MQNLKMIALVYLLLVLLNASQASDLDKRFKPASKIADELVGVVTDPFGLRRSTSNLLDGIDRLDDLEKNVNQHTKERINQLRNAALKVLREVDNVSKARIDQAAREVKEILLKLKDLEDEIFTNLVCAGEEGVDTLKRGLINLLDILSKSSPEVKIWAMKVKLDVNTPAYNEPNKQFDAYETASLIKISEAKSSMTAKELVFIYSNIARMARLTACHYKKEPAARERLYLKHLQFNETAQYWQWITLKTKS